MRRKSIHLLLIMLALFPMSAIAATPVQLEHQGLLLNANWQESAEPGSGPLFLIVHGTWAHGGMEIIAGLQDSLAANGYDSLAITLSLGVSDRQGFMSCDTVIKANHADAAAEINRWVEFAKTLSDHIVLVGHSRGGNQVMLYQQQFQAPEVERLVLIAPMTWNAAESAAGYEAQVGRPLADVMAQAQAQADPKAIIKAGVVYCPTVEVLASSFLSYYDAEPNRNTPALLATVRRPVLVFEGTEDPLANGFKSQVALFEKNQQVTVQWIDGADHFFRDLYTDELVDSMLEWLQR
jgi:pimeloyl-ACP methyl ester carboxylesterase